MPTEIIALNHKFYNQFKNGADFSLNTSDYNNNLAGSVMNRIRYEYDVLVRWYSLATPSNNMIISGTSTIIERAQGSWIADGFSSGDSIKIYSTVVGTGFYEITAITPSVIYITHISGVVVPDGTYGDIGSAIVIIGKTPLTALIYKFSLIENSESFNITSKVSGNDQAYYVSEVGSGSPRVTTARQMIKSGSYEDWITCQGGSFKQTIAYVSTNSDYYYQQKFHVIVDFIVVPFYLDGELTNLQTLVTPALLAGLASLKYVYELEFRTVLSNPNTAKTARIENNLGAIAWFNENFNGFQNNYSIKSVAYEDAVSAASADGLLLGSKTKVTIIVNKNGGFGGNQRVGLYHSYLPSQSEYSDAFTDLEDNFIYDNSFFTTGAGPTIGTNVIKSLSASIISSELVIVAELEFSTTLQLRLSPESFYALAVEVGDVNLSNGASDRVLLLADVSNYDASVDIPDLFGVDKFDIFTHNQNLP